MRFFFVFLLTAIINYFALWVMPWWIAMPIGFAVILLLPMRKNWQSFLSTATGTGLCWLVTAVIADQANEHILSHKMAQLFSLPGYGFMIAVTALVGFITGGLGGWLAGSLRRLFINPNDPVPIASAEE